MFSDDILIWFALNEKRVSVPINVIEQCFDENGSLVNLWKADSYQLSKLGLNNHQISSFIDYRRSVNSKIHEEQLNQIIWDKYRIIRFVDKEYPNQLKELVGQKLGPPLVLYHKGSLLDFKNSIAIVGTRECSHYGHMMARRIARKFAREGYTIISGLARGVDTEAHCGALEVPKGKTIAVLAWMKPIYPPENSLLAKDIERRGALIGEFFKSSLNYKRFSKEKFVERNRITSGISKCVIAIESDDEGGTVHQVKLALSQNRKVFALKPKKHNKRALKGFKLFLEAGAMPFNSANSVLNFLRTESQEYKREKSLEEYAS